MQLMTRENFELFLLHAEPDAEWVMAYIDYTQRWTEALRNGGGRFAEDTRTIGFDYIKRTTKKKTTDEE